MGSDLDDDMDDFYNTPPAAPDSVPPSPQKAPEKLLHSGEVVEKSFNLPSLRNPDLDSLHDVEAYASDVQPDQLEESLGRGSTRVPGLPQAMAVEVLTPISTLAGDIVNTSQTELSNYAGSNVIQESISLLDVEQGARDVNGLGELGTNEHRLLHSSDIITSVVPTAASSFVQEIEIHGAGGPYLNLVEQGQSPRKDDQHAEKSRQIEDEPLQIPHELQSAFSGSHSSLIPPLSPIETLARIPSAPPDDASVMGSQARQLSSGNGFDHQGIPETSVKVSGPSTSAPADDTATVQAAEAEFELNSSPIESSTDNSSVSSSDDNSDNDYVMLDPAEQARLLMQEDGGSEDEGTKRGAGSGPLRTLNEKPDEVVEKPDLIITSDMSIEVLGEVETLVDNLILVKAKTPAEYQVLETGSVLCLKDRTVIGVVAETLGRVQQPLYTVRFTNNTAISEAGISKNTVVYYVPQHSTYVFTQSLKAIKGSDASNIHDEEVGDDELEFSDDEAEADFKRNQKLQRQAKRGGRGASSNGLSRGPRQTEIHHAGRDGDVDSSFDDVAGISYDDEPYTPLARPTNLHEYTSKGESSSGSQHHSRGGYVVRGRGGQNSRGDRGDRGRGGRGRGRDRLDRAGGSNIGYSQPSTSHSYPRGGTSLSHPVTVRPDLSLPPAPPPPRPPYSMGPPKPPLPSSSFSQYSSYQPPQTSNYPSYNQGYTPGQTPYTYQANANHLPHPPSVSQLQPPHQQNAPQNQYIAQQYPPVGSNYTAQPSLPQVNPPLPPGSFVNPAFFGNGFQQPVRQPPYPPQYRGYPPPQQNGCQNGQR